MNVIRQLNFAIALIFILGSAHAELPSASTDDATIIKKIKTSDRVFGTVFSECSEEHLHREPGSGREHFNYSAKCTMKEPEDACERYEVRASGEIEGKDWVTVYDMQLHLLCLD